MPYPSWLGDFLAYVPNPSVMATGTFFTPSGTPAASGGGSVFAVDFGSTAAQYAPQALPLAATLSYRGDVANYGVGFYLAADSRVQMTLGGSVYPLDAYFGEPCIVPALNGGTGADGPFTGNPTQTNINLELVWADSPGLEWVYLKGGYWYVLRIATPSFGSTVTVSLVGETLSAPPSGETAPFFTTYVLSDEIP